MMKSIKVVAAIICKDNLVLATQRGHGDFKDMWEFPGGKIEDGESPEEAIVREIKEELGADIVVTGFLTTVEYDYPEFHLTMDCYLSKLADGSALELREHEAALWLSYEKLCEVEWLPADAAVANALLATNAT